MQKKSRKNCFSKFISLPIVISIGAAALLGLVLDDVTGLCIGSFLGLGIGFLIEIFFI